MKSLVAGTDAAREEHIDQVHDLQHPSTESTAGADVQRRTTSPRDAWKMQIASVKAAIAGLESVCSGIISQALESDMQAAAVIEDARRRIADVTSAADAAVHRARLQADVETAELHQVVERLRRELEAERNAHAADDKLPADEAAALKAQLKAARSECEDLACRLEAERAKRTRLIDAVRALHQSRPASETGGVVVSVHSYQADAEIHMVGETETESAPTQVAMVSPTSVDDAPHPLRETAATEREEDAAPGESADTVTLHFNLDDYARQLLDDIESVYDADEASGMPPSELVGRLLGNLVFATDVFDRRASYASGTGRVMFQQQLAIALDAKAGTSFGRHLAVAAYDYFQQRKQVGHANVA